MKKIIGILSLAALVGCSSTKYKKVEVEASKEKPDWVERSELFWEDDGHIYFKAHQSVPSNSRLSGCYSLASLDNRERLLTGISNDVSGAIDNAEQELSESVEVVLGKVRSSSYKGKVYGFSDVEQFYSRYDVIKGENDSSQRLDCFTLSKISKEDYNKTKREVVDAVAKVDAKLRDAIRQKQINFFESQMTNVRAPSSTEESPKEE